MTDPPRSQLAWSDKTYRATQTLSFAFKNFGDAPLISADTGAQAGTTTVLTAPRANGGTICHSLRATILGSGSSVNWSSSDKWYEARLDGEAQDPVPAEVGRKMLGGVGHWSASQATPSLAWDVSLRFSEGADLSLSTRSRYALQRATSNGISLDLDESIKAFGPRESFGGPFHLLHGFVMVRRFPSYIIYVTITSDKYSTTIPVYFANAASRSLGEIVVGQVDCLRQITF